MSAGIVWHESTIEPGEVDGELLIDENGNLLKLENGKLVEVESEETGEAEETGKGKKIKINEKQKKHIFRDADGHLTEDTKTNRQKLEDVANDKGNYLGNDKYGNEWYGKNNPDGSQTWVKVRNGSIENGGVNQTPKTYNPQTGLSSPTRPMKK